MVSVNELFFLNNRVIHITGNQYKKPLVAISTIPKLKKNPKIKRNIIATRHWNRAFSMDAFSINAVKVAPLRIIENGISIDTASATPPLRGCADNHLEYLLIRFILVPICVRQQRKVSCSFYSGCQLSLIPRFCASDSTGNYFTSLCYKAFQ